MKELFGIPLQKRARAALISSGLYLLLSLFVLFFVGYNEIVRLFMPLMPALFLGLAMHFVLKREERYILSEKMPVALVVVTAAFMLLFYDEPELSQYAVAFSGVYALCFLAVIHIFFRINLIFKDYLHAFIIGTLILLPAVPVFRTWVNPLTVSIGSALWQTMLGLIVERAWQRTYAVKA